MSLWNKIREARPEIKDSSINAYTTSINTICQALGCKDNNDLTFLNDYHKVMDYLDTLDKETTKRNLLASIVVVLKAIDKNNKVIEKYSKTLKDANSSIFATLKTQKKSEKQKENWVEYEDLVNLSNELLERVNKFRDEDNLNNAQFWMLQDLVILRSYLVSPMRNNYANMDVIDESDYKEINKDKNNYLLIEDDMPTTFILNTYKNSKHLGRKLIDIPEDTQEIIKLWLKHNTTGHFLLNRKGEPMNSNNLTKHLQSMFTKYLGKPVAASLIRHIITSYEDRDKPTILEKEEEKERIEKKYQHSVGMHDLYRKID